MWRSHGSSFNCFRPSAIRLRSWSTEITWQVPGRSHDGCVLDNGNLLISDWEIAREYKAGTTDVVWQYRMAPEAKELGTPQRLANGLTMLVERGPNPRIIEVGLHPDGSLRDRYDVVAFASGGRRDVFTHYPAR